MKVIITEQNVPVVQEILEAMGAGPTAKPGAAVNMVLTALGKAYAAYLRGDNSQIPQAIAQHMGSRTPQPAPVPEASTNTGFEPAELTQEVSATKTNSDIIQGLF